MNAQVCWQDDFVFQFSFKSSTSLIFNFKVKYSNRVRWEDHTWLSRKWWHVGQKSQQNCQHKKSRVAFPLAYFHFTVTYFDGKGQSHAHFDWISRKRWQIGQILLLPTNRKTDAASPLLQLDLTLAHYNGHGQGHVHFHCEYVTNGKR